LCFSETQKTTTHIQTQDKHVYIYILIYIDIHINKLGPMLVLSFYESF